MAGRSIQYQNSSLVGASGGRGARLWLQRSPTSWRRACVCSALQGGDEDNRQEQQLTATSRVPAGPLSEPPSSAKDVRIALGIDKDDRSESNNEKFFMRFMDKAQELMDKLQVIADIVTDYTESDVYQVRSLQFAILLFPIWLLFLLVAAGAIQLPFPLPFL